MANLSLEVVLELVDRLTGPARDAIEALGQFGAAARQAAGADSGLRPDRWIEERSAINDATQAAKQFAGAATGATDAGKGVDTSWIELAGTIDKAIGAVDLFKGATASAAEAGKGVDSSWLALAGDIDRATAAVGRFSGAEETAATKGPHGTGGGRGEHGPSLGKAFETATDMVGMIEAPKAVEGMWEAGARILGEEIAMKIAGMSPELIAESHARAVEYSQEYKLFGISELEANIREGRTVFTSDEHAREMTPDVLKLGTLLEKAQRGTGLMGSYAFTRTLEEAGLTANPARAHAFYEDAARALNFFGGTVTGQDYLDTFNRAGIYGRNWDEDFTKYALPHLMQSLHGDITGTMLGTFGQMIVGGHLSGPELRSLEQLHLLDESKVIKRDKQGHAMEISPGAVIGSDIAQRNPYEFANFIGAKMKEAGMSEVAQVEWLTSVFGNRNAAKAIYTLMHDTASFQRTKEGIDNPENKGLQAYKDVSGDPMVAFSEFKTSLENLAGIASEPLMAPVAKGLDLLAGGISKLTGALDGHPIEQTALSVGATGALAYWGWKAFTGLGAGIGSWLGVSGAKGAAEGGAAAVGAGTATGEAGAVAEGWLPWAMRTASAATGPLAVANIGSWTTPEEDQILAGMIAREKAEAAMRVSHEARDEAAASRGAPGPDATKKAQVDTSAFDAAADKANATGAAMKAAIERPLNPQINMGVLDAMEAKLRSINSLMGQINGFGGGGRASAPLYDHVPGGH